jgi:xylulokinase
MPHYLIAHDLGTSGDKATLFTTDGTLVRSITTAYDTHFFNSTWAEQDPDIWWKAVCDGTHALLEGIDRSMVAAMSFSGQMMGCVPVDKTGHALRPAMIWADQRGQAQEKRLRERISETDFYHITGHRISASYSLEKLMWIRDNEPEVFPSIFKMLQPKDYIIHRLTGSFVTDYSDASGTNCFDLRNLVWSEKILQAADIDGSLLPDACPSTHIAGEVYGAAADACGLPSGTPIVIGGGDGVCAAVGAGSVKTGDTFNYLGSSAWIAMTSDAPVFDPEMRTYTWAHLIPGKYSPNGTMQAAGNSYQFMRRTVCRDLEAQAKACGKSVYQLMNEEAAASPLGANGLLYLPYLLGERSPRWNSEARGTLIGLKMEHTRGDILRACIEGILMNLCIILDVLRTDTDIREINLIGGMAKGGIVQQILADLYGVRVHRLNWLDEATSMGAAVAAGVGAGVLPDFTAIDRFVKTDVTVEPDQDNRRRYRELRQMFEESYQALLETYHHLSSWNA